MNNCVPTEEQQKGINQGNEIMLRGTLFGFPFRLFKTYVKIHSQNQLELLLLPLLSDQIAEFISEIKKYSGCLGTDPNWWQESYYGGPLG
jgi:hypothetical protein